MIFTSFSARFAPNLWARPHTVLATKSKWVGLTCGSAGLVWKDKLGDAAAPLYQGPCVNALRIHPGP
jgi:hypothetical protein